MLTFLLPLFATVAAGGLFKQLFLSRYSSAGMYFNAVASTVLLLMVASVILAVFRSRPLLAPAFALLSTMLITTAFYAREFSPYAKQISLGVTIVALTTWLLAYLGCLLRQRLQHMD